ncbi:MAG: thiamine phosphate synthase [Acidobacteriota bacterium]
MSGPRLLAISDDAALQRLEDWIERLAAAGVDSLQIRHKTSSDRLLLELAQRAVRAADGRLQVLINGRPDLAAAAGADGVHLPSAGLPVREVRERWPEMRIGLSTHRLEEVEAAAGLADYVTFGPVYPTPSKERFGPPVGPEALCKATRFGVPVLGLGGVEASRLASLAAAGASGAAAIRALRGADSLVQMAQEAARLWPCRLLP